MVEATVPATSANLGCAFDSAAIALDLHLTVEAVPLSSPGLELKVEGEGVGKIAEDASNLVVQAISRFHGITGTPIPGLRVRLASQIPVGVGLGSSAAAIVAGLLIGSQLTRHPVDDATLLGLAAELDGHPDNVAAALLGGLVVVAAAPNRVVSRKARIPEALRFTLAVPERPLPTSEARAVLPGSFPRDDAVHNLQRAVLLVASAFSGQFDFEPEFFADRWHQSRRADLLPGLAECLALEHPDLLGVCLSGAGSSVLAVSRGGATDEIAARLRELLERRGVAVRTMTLSADNLGAKGRLRAEAASP